MAAKDDKFHGRTCMVTGASSGIGLAAARELAARGARVVLVCRDGQRGEVALNAIVSATGNNAVELVLADLSSQAAIRRLAQRFLASNRPLHVLLNNAGVFMLKRTLTVDGLETTFATNHLAYFLLTTLLLERMIESAPARIVNVASDAHRLKGVRMRFDDLQGEREYRSMRAYGQSKLANILFTRELARRIESAGVTANCLHPGMVATGLASNNGMVARGVLRLLRPFSRSPEQGAETAVWLCSSSDVDGVSGLYFADGRPHAPSRAAQDDSHARLLWELSEQMTVRSPDVEHSVAGTSSYEGENS